MNNKAMDDFDIVKKIKTIQRIGDRNSLKTDDIYALNLLQPLLGGYPFLPFSASALRPFCVVHMINDVIINNRKNIIEFGSGISSILIGRLIKKNSLDTKLITIEHDESWAKALARIIKSEQIEDVVDIYHAALSDCDIALDGNQWYNLQVLNNIIKDKKFDMVIIDGPPAWETSKAKARYPAVPFIIDNLQDNFSVYLDDAIRSGEQASIKIWEAKYGMRFDVAGKSLAYYYSGDALNTEPFGYY